MSQEALDHLLLGYRQFRAGRYIEQANLFQTLGQGQSPKVMVISCADSRCDPADIFSASPGELFVVRNVAGLVPPYLDPDGAPGVHGVSAAVEFAVDHLKVETIVVMGHASCGGCSASIAGHSGPKIGGAFLGPWVDLLEPARDRAMARAQGPALQTAMEEEVVAETLKNLAGFPFIRRAMDARGLTLQGAWFSIASGELHWRNEDTGLFDLVDAN